MDLVFSAPDGIGGTIIPPPDKSITHRVLMLASVSLGTCRIRNPLYTGDCLSTLGCIEELGITVNREGFKQERELLIEGRGVRGYREPVHVLDAGNSGTTLRLLSGLLAGLPIYAVITGDDSLLNRPMGRITEPLRQMGAHISGRRNASLAPLTFLPGKGSLHGMDYELSIPSAQVKSSILLAGLKSEDSIVLRGRIDSRDHTERILKFLGLPIESDNGSIVLHPGGVVPDFVVTVPGDISSASFFIAASLLSGKKLTVESCGLNPTRLGFVEVLRRMNAAIRVTEERSEMGEPVGSITVEASRLEGISLKGEDIPGMIDELPLLAAVAMACEGVTVVHGAEELRHKESDRLETTASMIRALGGEIEVYEDGFEIEGPQSLRPGVVESKGDHRIAMTAAVLSTIAGNVRVVGFDAASVSYPSFADDFISLGGRIDN